MGGTVLFWESDKNKNVGGGPLNTCGWGLLRKESPAPRLSCDFAHRFYGAAGQESFSFPFTVFWKPGRHHWAAIPSFLPFPFGRAELLSVLPLPQGLKALWRLDFCVGNWWDVPSCSNRFTIPNTPPHPPLAAKSSDTMLPTVGEKMCVLIAPWYSPLLPCGQRRHPVKWSRSFGGSQTELQAHYRKHNLESQLKIYLAWQGCTCMCDLRLNSSRGHISGLEVPRSTCRWRCGPFCHGRLWPQALHNVAGSPLMGGKITKLMSIFFIFLAFLNHREMWCRCVESQGKEKYVYKMRSHSCL